MIERLSSVCGSSVSRETFATLDRYVDLLQRASSTQNLIAASTMDEIWERHIVDSAQLFRFAEPHHDWLDIGSGAGLPGIVLAILSPDPVTLLEPRRLRAEFLASVITDLNLTNATIVRGKPSVLRGKFQRVTARAVAPADKLIEMSHHLSRSDTVWVLPKGRNAKKELDDLRSTWQGSVRLETSFTDPDASILLASEMKPRGKR